MKIPREVISAVTPGTTNDELRTISEEHGIPYVDLWILRQNQTRLFNRGVSGTMRHYRNKETW